MVCLPSNYGFIESISFNSPEETQELTLSVNKNGLKIVLTPDSNGRIWMGMFPYVIAPFSPLFMSTAISTKIKVIYHSSFYVSQFQGAIGKYFGYPVHTFLGNEKVTIVNGMINRSDFALRKSDNN